MYVYKIDDDYDFMYWNTALDELSKVEDVAERRAFHWGFDSKSEDNFKYNDIVSVIPSQFFAALSLQVTQSIHLLITEYGFDFDRLNGIFLQRVNEIEAGPDLSFIVGISGASKYIVCREDMSSRMHSFLKAELLGSHFHEKSKPELLH